jgi:hypothetical protein
MEASGQFLAPVDLLTVHVGQFSSTSGGRSVGIVRLRTTAMEFSVDVR